MPVIFCLSYCNFPVLEEYVSYIQYTLQYTETDGTRIEARHVYLLILLLSFPPKIQVLAFQNISAKLESCVSVIALIH